MKNFMKKKTKKILSLIISFVLLTSIHVSAQEVQTQRAISESKMLELEKEFYNVREILLSFRNDFNKKLSGFRIKRVTDTHLFWDHIGLVQEKIDKLDKSYINFLDKTYSYTDYIFEEEGKTALERSTYKYLGTPGVYVKNYHLEEGAMLEKMRGMIDELEQTWFKAENFEDILAMAKEQEIVVNDLVNALDKRLTEVKGVLERSISKNNEIYINNMTEIIEKHITREDVLKRTIVKISPAEREAIGLFLKNNNLKASKIELAKGIRKYAIAMGKKDVPSVFKLLKSGVLNTLEAREFNETVQSKYGKLIDDFQIFRNNKYVSPQWTIRRILRTTPVMIVGAVLTVGAITEIMSNNSFNKNSVWAGRMSKLDSKIKQGKASFAESVLYYADESSLSVINKDTEHLINAINLALALKQADQDFEIIVHNIEAELQKGYKSSLEDDMQNSLDKHYNVFTKKTESLM